MTKPSHIPLLIAALMLLSTPAFATIVYTNGQTRTTPITATETLQIDNAGSAIQSGTITGTGTAITKTGNGSLTLSGINTYTGMTNIFGGILAISSTNAIGSNSLTFDNLGTLKTTGVTSLSNNIVVNGNGGGGKIIADVSNFTYSGNITGMHELILASGGGSRTVFTLTGSNASHGGGISLTNSDLVIANTTNVGSGDFKLQGDSAEIFLSQDMTLSNKFIFNASNTNSINTGGHNITLNGYGGVGTRLILNGGGTLTFYGTNGGVGVPYRFEGALETVTTHLIGYSGNITGNVINTSQVTFNELSYGLYHGNITGSGSFDKIGTGTLAVMGSIANTGGITVSNGTLSFGFGDARGSITGNITNNSKVSFNRSDMYTYDDVISGAGSVSQDYYSGTTILNGVNTYSGVTTVNAGILQIGDSTHAAASIAGDADVVGGTLTGYGTIGGSVTNGANVSLDQLNTLAINGNYTQSSAGALTIRVSPDSAGKLIVGGAASLNGTLALNFDPGTYAAKTYTILTATSVTGTFTTITGTTPDGFVVIPNYTSTAVTFDLAVPTTPVPAPSGVSELGATTSSTITSSNQASATIFDHLGESGSGDTGASGERDTLTFASLTNKSITNSENTQAGLNGLAKALPEVAKKNGGWFKGTGNLASVESSGGKAGFSSETGGFMFGFDREVDKGVRIGAAGGYDHTNLSTFNGINATAETNSMRFAIYGSKMFENDIALDAQIGYALHMIDGDRFESATGTIATNSHDANEYSTGFQVSKKFNINGFTFKPKAGLNYAHVDEDGYTETGAGLFNATIASKSINSLRLSTGFGISHPMKPRDGWAFTPEMHIKYSYEALDSTSATSGSQRGIGFASTGVEPSHHILTTGIGFSTNIDDDLSAFGSYDVDLPTGNSFEQTFTVGMRLSF